MKKTFSLFVTIFIVTLGLILFFNIGATKVSASTYGDLTYSVSKGKVTITACDASATSVAIPDSIEGYPVTSIGDRAFHYCFYLTSVDIPDSVTSIGKEAFGECTSLTNIDIPDSITIIPDYAFYYCRNLASIDIPESVTSIGESAFGECTSLTNIDIPDSITIIADYAFFGCSSIRSICIPNSVTSIPDYAFYYCRNLASIYIPESVTSIGESAFGECTSLTSVYIPESVTSIGNYAFYNCTSLTKIFYNAVWRIICNNNNIFYNAGRSCEGIKVTIGKNVKYIPDFLFDPCNNPSYSPKITEIFFEEGSVCESIGESAFRNCMEIASITIPSNVTSIGSSAFDNCSSLAHINYNATDVSFYGDNIFRNAGKICDEVKLTIGRGVKNIPSYLFRSVNLTEVIFEEESVCESIGSYSFSSCTSLTRIDIPNNVTSIGESAFYGCTSLTSITIPSTISSMGDYAFFGCTNLTNIYYDAVNVTDLYSNSCVFSKAGQSGEGIKVSIGMDVKHIPAYLFAHNYDSSSSPKITQIIFEEGSVCESIGDYAFIGCTDLTYIYYNAKNVDNLSFDNYVFYKAGQTGEGIKLIIGKDVNHIPSNLFNPCNNSSYSPLITEIIFEEGSVCESIGSYAFKGCLGIKSILVTNIESWCGIDFENFGANPLYYGKKLYIRDSLVESLVVPDGIAEIRDYAFIGCTSIKSVKLSQGVEKICEWAFRDCSNLETVYVPASLTNVEDEAFYKCKRLSQVIYSGTETEWNAICLGTNNEPIIDASRHTHTFGDWVTVTSPDCIKKGSEQRICLDCLESETRPVNALGHDEIQYDGQESTCTEIGWSPYVTCSRCDHSTYVVLPAKGHSYLDWVISLEPKENMEGFKSRTCSVCGDEMTESIAYASGDVDGDGALTNSDITLALRTISGWDSSGEVVRMDVNYDGAITNRDLIAIIQKLAGWN